jgi:hypothetical protein
MHRKILKDLSMILQIHFKTTNKKKLIWIHLNSGYRRLKAVHTRIKLRVKGTLHGPQYNYINLYIHVRLPSGLTGPGQNSN